MGLFGVQPAAGFDRPLVLMSECHRRIERFIETLERVARLSGRPLDDDQRAALQGAMTYFREAAPLHTADEEESLFPRLRANDDPRAHALNERCHDLENDHRKAEGLHAVVDSIGERWLLENALPEQEGERMLDAVLELRRIYRAHIAYEDNELFPAAEALLHAEERRELGREMANRRGIVQTSLPSRGHDL
jgi:hemerythrin-like domain-containing protein